MELRNAILAESLPLPPIPSGLMYQYVVAENGLFIRAEDSRMEAMVPVAYAHNHGLAKVEPYARLKVSKIPFMWLSAVLKSARAKLPGEVMFQFFWRGTEIGWKCVKPTQIRLLASVAFEDANPDPVIDLHSHGTLKAFFSQTDDTDEQGFRFYAVIGEIEDENPYLAVRVGVYGHHWIVNAMAVFESIVPFIQSIPEIEKLIAEEDHETIA